MGLSRACAGAVLDSNSCELSLCFCCMLRQKICCMPDETTDIAATARPSGLSLIWKSLIVLRRRTLPCQMTEQLPLAGLDGRAGEGVPMRVQASGVSVRNACGGAR